MKVTQLCPTLCDPKDCSPPGSSVRGILQARILEWVAISFSIFVLMSLFSLSLKSGIFPGYGILVRCPKDAMILSVFHHFYWEVLSLLFDDKASFKGYTLCCYFSIVWPQFAVIESLYFDVWWASKPPLPLPTLPHIWASSENLGASSVCASGKSKPHKSEPCMGSLIPAPSSYNHNNWSQCFPPPPWLSWSFFFVFILLGICKVFWICVLISL